MRFATMVPLICAVLLTPSCQNAMAPVQQSERDEPIARSESGRLIVHVFWDNQGVPNKRVEVLELHLSTKTDEAGYATFDLPAGDYTLRAYDINRGGPPRLYIDTSVTITAGEKVQIDVFDCLPCV